MSGLFDLDQDGNRALDERAALNPLDLKAEPILPAWEGIGEAAKGFTRPAASALRTGVLVGAALTPARFAAGDEAVDELVRFSDGVIEANTADAATMGSAAKALNTGGQFVGMVPFLFASPTGFLADAAVSPAVDLVGQGVDEGTAAGVGGINLAINAAGLRMPAAFGATLPTRLATGAGSNLALGAAGDAASAGALDLGGYADQAAAYDVTNPYSRGLDTLMGLAFGAQVHVSARPTAAQRDAVLTARNSDHRDNRTLPGDPIAPGADVRHVDTIERALEQLTGGEVVDVSPMLREGDFALRPEAANPRAAAVFDGAVERVLAVEGGFVDDASDRGGATNFGISSRAHPDVDVASLTRDQAKAIYRREYWNAIEADALPEPLREVAFDAAVNQGVNWTKRALAEAGGDPRAFLQLREARYRDIVAKDPSQQKFLRGWLNRLERFDTGASHPDDVPNFGMAEAPRTVPDGDALLTDTSTIPGREGLRAQLVDEHFTDAAPRLLAEGERPIAWVMGGGGASGKGTLVKRLKADGEIPERGAVEIDPDRIKTGGDGVSGIPEYAALRARGDGRAAAVVHEESSQVAKTVLARAIEGKFDLVLDRTLGDQAKGLAELQALKNAGYEVRLFGVTVDPRAALQRAHARAEKSGRHVPPGRLLEAHKGFAGAFEEYARLADSADLFDNSGAAHVRIAQADSQGALTIHDAGAYDAFRGRSQINEQATTFRALETSLNRGNPPPTGRDDARGMGGSAPSARRAGNAAEPGGQPQGQGVTETPRDAAARLATEIPDAMVLDGFDADGEPRYVRMADALAEIESEFQRAANEAQAFPAAVSCFLRRGGNAA